MPLAGISGRLGIQNQRQRNERRRSLTTGTPSTVQQVKPQRRNSTASTISAPPARIHHRESLASPDIINRHSIPELVPHGASGTTVDKGNDPWKDLQKTLTPHVATLPEPVGEGDEEEV